MKNVKIRNGVIDVKCLNDIVKDKRNFHIEINILNAAFKAANIRISNDPVIDTRIPFTFTTVMKFITGHVKDLNTTITI